MKLWLSIFFLFWIRPAWAQTVYLTPEEALKRAFQNSQQVISDKKQLTDPQKSFVEKTLGKALAKTQWTFYLGKSGKQTDGYALIDNEVGKTEPITFMTMIGPDGKVRQVEILVYREPIGGEIQSDNFRKQFLNKTAADPVRSGQDIKNISGATLSSRAVSLGVKRALLLWKEFYDKTP